MNKPDSEPLAQFIRRKAGINEREGVFSRCLGRGAHVESRVEEARSRPSNRRRSHVGYYPRKRVRWCAAVYKVMGHLQTHAPQQTAPAALGSRPGPPKTKSILVIAVGHHEIATPSIFAFGRFRCCAAGRPTRSGRTDIDRAIPRRRRSLTTARSHLPTRGNAPPGLNALRSGYALATAVQPRRILILIDVAVLTLIVALQWKMTRPQNHLPTPNPRARCTAIALPTAISCLGAFRPPATSARG
jgi:hypothetical protein